MTPRTILNKCLPCATILACALFHTPAISETPEELERQAEMLQTMQAIDRQVRAAERPVSNLSRIGSTQSVPAPVITPDLLPQAPTDAVIDRADDTVAVKRRNEDVVISKDTTLRHFGYDVFARTPDAFKPNAVGPVDPGYMVGPGDVLRLAVWGQAEFSYELTVSDDGKILIPTTGQVTVSGIPFKELHNKIQNLLSRNYSGLTSSPQRTFMDLSVARQRPVRIYIMGEVRQPGGYTVSSFANAFAALYSVGGPLERGSMREIKVIRNNVTVATVDIYDYLLTGGSATDVRLQNNDVVFVPPRGKTVQVSGAVLRPAIYELKQGENFQKLLTFCGGVLSASNVDKAHIQRILPFAQRTDAHQVAQMISIELKQYVEGKADFSLYDMDKIVIDRLFDDLRNFVTLTGAVQYPGVYQSDNMTLKDLIFRHGRIIDNKTLTARADLIRLNEDRITTSVIPINLNDLQKGTGDRRILPGDEVVVYEIEVARPIDLQITIEGEVRNPGTYTLHTNMALTDAILSAGGFTRWALKNRFDVYRRDTTDYDKLITVYQTQLPDGSGVSFYDAEQRIFFLKDRDRIVVRPDPNISAGRFVTITGAVKYTGTYALENKNERFSSVIKRAGGFQSDAYLNGIVITRNGKRVIVDSDAIYNRKRKKEDVVLHDNDSIYIPQNPNTVMVSGEVNAPGLYGFIPGMNMRGYIDRAGGYTDSVNFVLVADPSGETRKVKKGASISINDGSAILVTKKPPKPPRQGTSTFEVVKDSLAIAISALTVIALVITLNDQRNNN